MIDDYIDENRVSSKDEYGRKPLLTTSNGRIAASTIRTYVNKWSAPCKTGECPYDLDPDECESAQKSGNMDCPDKRSPHDVRKGFITHLRKVGIPKEIVAEEVDALPKVVEKYYDKCTKAEKRKIRKAAIDSLRDAYDPDDFD